MKNFKKIAATIAALSLAACVAVPMSATVFTASAEATAKHITVNGGTGETDKNSHTYTAYRIFDGTATNSGFNETAKQTLTNVTWAKTDSLESLQSSTLAITGVVEKTTLGSLFTDARSAADVVKILGGYENNSSVAKAFAEWAVANKGNMIEVTALDNVEKDGYYVIEDTTASLTDGTRTLYLLGVYDADTGAEVNVKADLPSFEKFIRDVNESNITTGDTTTPDTWQKSADHDVEDDVEFQLKATLPTDYNEYDRYTLKFHDDLSSEMSKAVFDTPSVSMVYIDVNANGTYDGDDIEIQSKDYTWTSPVTSTHTDYSGCDFEVTINNLKKEGLLPTATQVDLDTNPSDDIHNYVMPNVIVEYKAKLNTSAVIGSDGNWNGAYLEYSNNPYNEGKGGSDDTPDENTSKTPESKVVTFTYEVDVEKVDGNKQPLAGAGFTLYKWDSDAGAEKAGDWVQVGNEQTVSGPLDGGAKAEYKFSGVDAGKYKLVETTTPGGYNTAPDVIFEVRATHDGSGTSLTALEVYNEDNTLISSSDGTLGSLTDGKLFTASSTSGKVATQIENNKGATLPSTGGIGTTIFYVVGGVLVVGAGVTLITKKRMTKD